MNSQTVTVVRISAQEIKDKFGLCGDIVAFGYPSRQTAGGVYDRHVVIKLVITTAPTVAAASVASTKRAAARRHLEES